MDSRSPVIEKHRPLRMWARSDDGPWFRTVAAASESIPDFDWFRDEPAQAMYVCCRECGRDWPCR